MTDLLMATWVMAVVALLCADASGGESIRLYPAPPEEAPSPDFTVEANGQPVFVYQAKVRHEIAKPPGSIWTHEMGAKAEMASFACFDFDGKVAVAVKPNRPFQKATLHPASYGIQARAEGGVVRFELDQPRKLTLLLDGSDQRPLHLFTNPLETDVPKQGDPNVIYFGPGVHKTGPIEVKSGQTVYLAGGAIVRGQILPDEKPTHSARTGLNHYGPLIHVQNASNVRVRGRGILDGGDMPHASRALVVIAGSSDVQVDGIVIRDSPNWAVSMHGGSERVTVTNVSQISGRLNSDGINSVNSRAIRIRNCFVRNRDDSIVIKTTQPKGEASDILVEGCVIWNDWGYALGITYETRAPIHGVVFRDCDVLDALFWALGIHVVDSATMSDIRFENIRVERTRGGLIRLGITHDMWATDKERGRIRSVVFDNVRFTGPGSPRSEILGLDPAHRVEDVTFRNLRIGGQLIRDAAQGHFNINAHTADIRFE
jgi:hypothetical protein